MFDNKQYFDRRTQGDCFRYDHHFYYFQPNQMILDSFVPLKSKQLFVLYCSAEEVLDLGT